jgi:phosphatidylserine/phosphatidylglycerophosphate/cardiolipin synthase-like enzyme
LVDLLDAVSKKGAVRILLWNGANFIFKPNRKETARVKQALEASVGGDFKIILDDTQHITHCHHQKAVVIDGRVAFVGGMDLTSFAGDRFDSNRHPLRAGLSWHDVQLKLEGEIVADVEQNFRQRWEAVAPEPLRSLPHRDPEIDLNWHLPAQVIRTIPRRVYKFAKHGEFGIHHSYLNLIAGAKHFIYLENQYLWSPHVLDALKKAIQKPRSAPFHIVIVLPAHADDGKYDNDQHVNELRKLDKGRGKISFYTLYTSGPGMGINPFTYRGIYVHSKTTIVDDEWFSVGSANLNNRGMVTDSEINVLVHNPELAKSLRLNLWAEHLKMTPAAVGDCTVEELIGRVWREQADRNEEIFKEKKEPFYSALFPYQMGRMPDSWILEELETLTFEH